MLQSANLSNCGPLAHTLLHFIILLPSLNSYTFSFHRLSQADSLISRKFKVENSYAWAKLSSLRPHW